MISHHFIFLTILITFCLQNQVHSSPVLLWSNANIPQSSVPLAALTPQNLISNYICKLTNEQIELRVFAVNDLTIEDIQRGPQRKHPILLDAKNENTNFRFFPNIINDVYQAFSLIPQSNNMQCSHIHFQLKSTKIYETLEDALNTIQANVDSIGTDSSNTMIIALVKAPSDVHESSRQRRQTTANETDVLISTDKTCMFYADKLYWNSANGTKSSGQIYELNVTTSSCQTNTTTTALDKNKFVTVDLVWQNQAIPTARVHMSLTAKIIDRYWYLENATLNNTTYRYFAFGMHNRMDTPPTYSYVCTTGIFVRYDNNTKYGAYNFNDKFYLTNLQFQPFHGDGLQFGAPNYCTSFFTSGIWMGITSSLLCLAILLFGVHRLMSIKSNDRFDDPKGKPLLIKAQE